MSKEIKVKTYEVLVLCSNCSRKYTAEIEHGITVGEVACKGCGCCELEPFIASTKTPAPNSEVD